MDANAKLKIEAAEALLKKREQEIVLLLPSRHNNFMQLHHGKGEPWPVAEASALQDCIRLLQKALSDYNEALQYCKEVSNEAGYSK